MESGSSNSGFRVNFAKLSEFRERQWSDAHVVRNIFVNRRDPMNCAKHGLLNAFHDIINNEWLKGENGLGQRLSTLFNNVDKDKGCNCLQWAILNGEWRFVDVSVQYFLEFIDLEAKTEKIRAFKEKLNVLVSTLTTKQLLDFFLAKHQNDEIGLHLQKILAEINYSSNIIKMSWKSLNSKSVINDAPTTGIDERDGTVHYFLKECLDILALNIEQRDLDGIRVCLLNFKTLLECLKPARKDTIIIEMIDAVSDSNKLSSNEIRLELLDSLKCVIVSNIGSPTAFQTSAVKTKVFGFFDFCNQWCSEVQKIADAQQKSLYTRGRYLSTVSSLVLTCQLQFSGENQGFFDKLQIFFEFVGKLAGAAALNLQNAVEAIVMASKAIINYTNRLQTDRLIGLVIVVEGFNRVLSLTYRTAEVDVLIGLFQNIRNVFDNLKNDGVASFHEWTVFYGVLEFTLSFAIALRSNSDVQSIVCEFLLSNSNFAVRINPLVETTKLNSIISAKIAELISFIRSFPHKEDVLRRYSIAMDQMGAVSETKKKVWFQKLDSSIDFMNELIVSSHPPVFLEIRQRKIDGNLSSAAFCSYIERHIIGSNRKVCFQIEEEAIWSYMYGVRHLQKSLALFLFDIFDKFEDKYRECNPDFAAPLARAVNIASSFVNPAATHVEPDCSPSSVDEIPERKDEYTPITLEIKEIEIQAIIKMRNRPASKRSKPSLQESISLLHYLINNKCDVGDILNQGLLLVGATTAGKSTLANILAGCDMVMDKTYRVSPNSQVKEQTRIGHDIHSCTMQTEIVLTADWLIGDTAGLHDTRGFEFSVANAVNIYKFLSRCRNVRIILVTSYSVLMNPACLAAVACDVWAQLQKMFECPLADVYKCMLFAFTNTIVDDPEMVMEKIEQFYESIDIQEGNVPYVLVNPVGSADEKQKQLQYLNEKICSVGSLNNCAQLINVALGHNERDVKDILAELSKISSFLENNQFQAVVDRFKLMENLDCIQNAIVNTGLADFRLCVKKYFESQVAIVNDLLIRTPSSNDCLKLKRLIRVLSDSMVLDVCFLGTHECGYSSQMNEKIINSIENREYAKQSDCLNQIGSNCATQIQALSKNIAVLFSDARANNDFDVLRNISELKGPPEDFFDAQSIASFAGNIADINSVCNEIRDKMSKFPHCFINYRKAEFENASVEFQRCITGLLNDAIRSAKRESRLLEFRCSFRRLSQQAEQIIEKEANVMLTCCIAVRDDQFEELKKCGFRHIDVVTVQTIAMELSECRVELMNFVLTWKAKSMARMVAWFVNKLDEAAENLNVQTLVEFKGHLESFHNLDAAEFGRYRSKLSKKLFEFKEAKVHLAIKDHNDNFVKDMTEYLAYFKLLHHIPLLFDDGFVEKHLADLNRKERNIEI